MGLEGLGDLEVAESLLWVALALRECPGFGTSCGLILGLRVQVPISLPSWRCGIAHVMRLI